MKKIIATTAAAFLAAVASPSMATTIFTPGSQVISVTNGSGTFGAQTDEIGSFSHTFTFSVPVQGNYGASTVTTIIRGLRDIDFTSIKLDSSPYTQISFDPGSETWELTNVLLTSGSHSITLSGNKIGAGFSAYAGTLELGSVPEPAAWGMMLLGFGLVGSSMRSRKGKTTVVYA